MNNTVLETCKTLFCHYKSDLCHNGATRYHTVAENEETYHILITALTEIGFEPYAAHKEAENLFADLVCTKEELQIHLSFYAPELSLTAILTEGEALPPRQETVTATVTPLVTQVKLAYCAADCGMSYVIRLCDGRFVVIDGGYHEYEESLRLLEVLEEQNVTHPRPRIAAWFITHAHVDHFGAFVQLVEQYGDRIDLELLAFNWATEAMCLNLCDHSAVDRAVEQLKGRGCRILTPHTGQRLCFADATFDVLFACEDLLPEGHRGFNNTSLVLRMEQNSRRILWLGDAEPAACERICKRFPAESLHCEILQVGHHGYGGGSPELYRRADPEVLLWPCPDFWYHVVRMWPCNDVLRTSSRIKQIFVGGRYTTVLDMTAPIPEAPAEPTYAAGEVIAAWDMREIHRVIDLGWSGVSGGQTGCWPPHIRFSEEGECILNAEGRVGVIELLRPGLTEHAASYEMVLEGRIGALFGEIGVWCNDPMPTEMKTENVMRLEATVGQPLQLRLRLDATAVQMTLEVNGERVHTLPYVPAERRGLYLYLKETVLKIKTVEVRCL